MAETVDHSSANSILKKAWADGESVRPPYRPAPPRMAQLIELLLGATDITFKYILVTGFLAKCVNPKINARALQAGSSLNGAYDARSLCHGVVVGFEKSKGNLFGLSNEPFLNKPARHPEHDGTNLQIRNKLLSRKLHEVLELANTASPSDVYAGLVHILKTGRKRMAEFKSAEIVAKTNLSHVIRFSNEFLKETDGGSRLVAVWGAFTQLLSSEAEIKVYSPNASDFFGKTAGDVEVYYENILVSASECKQRPLNLDDVTHGIKKALTKGVPEYLFIYSAGLQDEQENEIKEAITKNSGKIDLALVNVWQEMHPLAKALNPKRRAIFGETVTDLLREMRKFDSANVAAEIWNRLTTQN